MMKGVGCVIWFGPSGNSESFTGREQAFVANAALVEKMGLNAYEYQCNKGTNIKKETAEKLVRKQKSRNKDEYPCSVLY